MSKTITLIELFNKMASFDEQENLPEEIKYRDCVFTKIYGEGISPDYINKNSDTILEYVATEADDLNEIVEIIEEQEEIDKLEIDENGYIHTNNGSWKGRKLDVEFAKAINKLAEEIKNIKEKQ